MNNKRIAKVAIVGVLSALSIVLYMFAKFPIPFLFPAFLDVQFSNLPAIIAGFSMGPVAGAAVVVVRTLVKLPFSGTLYAGELADLMIGLATVLTSSIIYKKMHSKKGAKIGMLFGVIAWIVFSIITNLIVVPFYIFLFFDGSTEAFIGVLSALPWFEGLTVNNFMIYYLLLAVIPFNLLLATLVYIVTYVVYKRVSNFIHRFDE